MSWMLDTGSWGYRMRRTIKLWEVFVIRFEEALERRRLRRLTPRARPATLCSG